jgi:hypothetical protein
LCGGDGEQRTCGSPAERGTETIEQHQMQDVFSLRPECQPDTDLRAALRRQICERAEQAHGSQQQRYAREDRQQRRFEICVER